MSNTYHPIAYRHPLYGPAEVTGGDAGVNIVSRMAGLRIFPDISAIFHRVTSAEVLTISPAPSAHAPRWNMGLWMCCGGASSVPDGAGSPRKPDMVMPARAKILFRM